MTTNHDTDTSEDDSLMAQANEQLKRELQQSQKPTLTTYRAPRRVVSLGISPSYVKDWTPADAFRELYQNCDHLSIIVPDQSLADQPAERENRRALGFIQCEKKTGRITIANPCMQLPINALALGFSTKDVHGAHDHLVGRHGEGLKLAVLVLSRDSYNLRGQLYHNGITLTNSTVGGAFLFAYNFASLTTCRDRRRLASWRDAARQVQRIWEEALRKQEDTILPLLVDLWRRHARSADAETIGPLLEPPAARRIWQYLLRESADKEFFYSERCNDQTDHEHNPGQPRQAPGTPTRHAVAHTACPLPHPNVEEKQQELFKDAKPYVIPDTTFARTVDRALRAYFALLKFTDHI
ncbi:hypothetical protein PENSUB_6120 [Penicillium subrubescens]|uniref:Uncharacterized protein n=1 Tax=Penicillium subrubescens TaxID=1316194 RepID=A0A1Q5U3F5_9EURO|nr:hypothetical protein PENSUB_6120 [Penicillium subrubescens]